MESGRKIRALLLSPICDDPSEPPPMGFAPERIMPAPPAPEHAIRHTAPRPAQARAV